MHAFFHPAQVDLDQILLDLLTSSSSIHSILPLSRVNRHFRSIAFKRLLKVFSNIGGIARNSNTGKVTVAQGKGYLKIGEGQQTHIDCDPVLFGNDPRWLFAQQGWGGMEQANEAVLTLAHYESKTTMCTFKPPSGHDTTLEFHEPCSDDKNGALYYDCESNGPTPFLLASSMWFVPSENERTSLNGFKFAIKGNRHPSRTPAIYPPISDQRGGKVQRSNFVFKNDWKGSIIVNRPKHWNKKDEFDQSYCCVQLKISQIFVPLVQLFVAPTTSRNDWNVWSSERRDGGWEEVEGFVWLREFERNFYDVEGEDEEEESEDDLVIVAG